MAAQTRSDAAAATSVPSGKGRRHTGDFLKNFANLVKKALLPGSALAGQPVEIWFQDEARVGQKGGHTDIWAEVGSRPSMVRDNGHDSAHLFGAICPARGEGAAAVNADAMNDHLKEIGTQVAPGAHAILVLDGAGWHRTAKKPTVPDNITLLPLPPYAPELNPIENVWACLRANKLCALVWDTYGAIVRACRDASRFPIDDPDASAHSGPGNGHVSMFRAVGIRHPVQPKYPGPRHRDGFL